MVLLRWRWCLKNGQKSSVFQKPEGPKGQKTLDGESPLFLACCRPTRKFLPVGYLLCNDKTFLSFTCWVSGTVVVVVVYSIIYKEKEEKILLNICARHHQTIQDMMFRYVLGTSPEHAAFLEHLERGVATEYFGDYVRKENASQVTLNAWVRGCVGALLQPVPTWAGESEAKREYVQTWNEYQDVQTQKSPGVGAQKSPPKWAWFSYT